MALQHPLIPAPVNDSNAATPAPVNGLTGADLARLRHSLDSSVSDNTKTMYNSAWRGFESWAQARGALAMPAAPPLVAAYLAWLAEERRLSVATVKLHRAALAAVHKAAGHADPTDNEAVRQIMKGIARAHGRPQKQAQPLTAEALAAVKATAKSRRSLGGPGKRQESAERASWRARVDVALLATLRDGLLRRSEAADLNWSDIAFRGRRRRAGHPAPVQDGPREHRRGTLRRQGSGPGPAGHQARDGAAGPQCKNLRDDRTAYRQPGQGGRRGRRPGRRFHWPQRPRGHGPGPGEERRGTARPDDRRPVEKLKNAGQVHGEAGGRPGARWLGITRRQESKPISIYGKQKWHKLPVGLIECSCSTP